MTIQSSTQTTYNTDRKIDKSAQTTSFDTLMNKLNKTNIKQGTSEHSTFIKDIAQRLTSDEGEQKNLEKTFSKMTAKDIDEFFIHTLAFEGNHSYTNPKNKDDFNLLLEKSTIHFQEMKQVAGTLGENTYKFMNQVINSILENQNKDEKIIYA